MAMMSGAARLTAMFCASLSNLAWVVISTPLLVEKVVPTGERFSTLKVAKKNSVTKTSAQKKAKKNLTVKKVV
jgi:predicted metal-binding membrane protein